MAGCSIVYRNNFIQSSDLNLMEHLWEVLERCIRKHEIISKSIIKQKFLEELKKIAAADTSKLVNSMQTLIRGHCLNRRFYILLLFM